MTQFLALDELRMEELNRKIHNDPVVFAQIVLGITLHSGQIRWLTNSKKRLNILRPGNRWGKTLVSAVKHIWQCMCKPRLDGKVYSHEEWYRVEYNTLNFGPTYELGRGALILAREMIQGNLLLPDGTTNKSMLKDWAIIDDRADAQQLPFLEFKTGAKMLGRSMNEMGVAFKMRKLAYISGDECADVPELWTLTNNTLLMRVLDYDGSVDFVGTPQPDGHDYMRMIEMAEDDMKLPNWETEGLYYTQRGRTYENTYIPKSALQEIERIADPVMREQIINGEYVETGDKYFGFERIQHSISDAVPQLDYAMPNRKYAIGVDFAGGESAWADYTVIMVVDYTDEPYQLVKMIRFKGGDVPIPMQYRMVEETVHAFGGAKLIIDSSALGGKNALAFLGHLQPISQEFGPHKSSTLKMEMLSSLKIAFDGGQSKTRRRERVRSVDGKWEDKVSDWGIIRIPRIDALVNELQNYMIDDQKIRNDCVMCLAMIIHWIEMRRPKLQRKTAFDFDFLSV